jgi:hypothetical protein
MQTLSLSLAAAALFGATLLAMPDAGSQTASAIPFWQLHGAAPAARDAAAVADLRQAVRPEEAETFMTAGR